MQIITQPATTTDMRRDPKALLKRVKKEKIVPILVNSQFEAAVISVNELNRLHEMIKDLKHELSVQGVLESEAEAERGETYGPFDTVEGFMDSINQAIEEDEN